MASASGSSAVAGETDRRINVLQVVGNAIAGGMESCVARLIEHLPADRFTSTVLCPFESPYTEKLRGLGAEVLITPMPVDNPPWCSLQLASGLVHSAAIDVVHAHMPNAHVLAGIVGCLTGKPVLATIHGRQMTMLDVEVHRTAGTHLTVVCKQTYFHALALGVNAARLTYIANGVDADVFSPRPAQRGSAGGLRDTLAIPVDAPLVGLVGRLHWEKAPDVFAEAALLSKQRLPHAHFVIVGDGPMRGQLADFITAFGLGSRLHLVAGWPDMPAAYNELDALVCPSYSEAMPLAVLEAMACAVPVVGSAVGAIPDLIEHGQTGYLVNAGDAKSIADRLVDLFSTASQRKAMAARARERAVKRLSLADSVGAFAQVLARLASSRTETRRMGAVPREPRKA